MQMEISGGNIGLTAGIRSRIQKQVAQALDRFSGHVRYVRVHVEDVNGRRGGVDKRCTLALQLPKQKPVVVRQIATDLYEAIDRAFTRAKTTVARQVGRVRPMRGSGKTYPQI